MNHLVILPILIPLLGAALSLFVEHRRYGPKVQRSVAWASLAALALAEALLIAQASEGQIIAYLLGDWPSRLGIVLVADRLAGWMAVREWLAPRRCPDGAMRPRLRIFPCCENLIRTLPALRHDEHRPEDAALTPHELTHAPDALRGFCSWWIDPAPRRRPPGRDLLRDGFSLPPAPAPAAALGEGEPLRVI